MRRETHWSSKVVGVKLAFFDTTWGENFITRLFPDIQMISVSFGGMEAWSPYRTYCFKTQEKENWCACCVTFKLGTSDGEEMDQVTDRWQRLWLGLRDCDVDNRY